MLRIIEYFAKSLKVNRNDTLECRTFGRRAFAVAGPTAWNSLFDDLRNLSRCDSYFGRFLKSILFSFY